jgi:hypothetical protein
VTLPAWSQLIAGAGMRLGWHVAARLAMSALPPVIDSRAGMLLGWHAAVRLATSALPPFIDLTYHNSVILWFPRLPHILKRCFVLNKIRPPSSQSLISQFHRPSTFTCYLHSIYIVIKCYLQMII